MVGFDAACPSILTKALSTEILYSIALNCIPLHWTTAQQRQLSTAFSIRFLKRHRQMRYINLKVRIQGCRASAASGLGDFDHKKEHRECQLSIFTFQVTIAEFRSAPRKWHCVLQCGEGNPPRHLVTYERNNECSLFLHTTLPTQQHPPAIRPTVSLKEIDKGQLPTAQKRRQFPKRIAPVQATRRLLKS